MYYSLSHIILFVPPSDRQFLEVSQESTADTAADRN
jgi:hypothetical protein